MKMIHSNHKVESGRKYSSSETVLIILKVHVFWGNDMWTNTSPEQKLTSAHLITAQYKEDTGRATWQSEQISTSTMSPLHAALLLPFLGLASAFSCPAPSGVVCDPSLESGDNVFAHHYSNSSQVSSIYIFMPTQYIYNIYAQILTQYTISIL